MRHVAEPAFSPSSSGWHPGSSASGFCRSANVPDEAAIERYTFLRKATRENSLSTVLWKRSQMQPERHEYEPCGQGHRLFAHQNQEPVDQRQRQAVVGPPNCYGQNRSGRGWTHEPTKSMPGQGRPPTHRAVDPHRGHRGGTLGRQPDNSVTAVHNYVVGR